MNILNIFFQFTNFIVCDWLIPGTTPFCILLISIIWLVSFLNAIAEHVPEYRVPEYNVPEHNVPEYSINEHNVPEHCVPEYKAHEHNVPEYKAHEHNVPEYNVPEQYLPPNIVFDKSDYFNFWLLIFCLSKMWNLIIKKQKSSKYPIKSHSFSLIEKLV